MKELEKANQDISKVQVEAEAKKQEKVEFKPEYSIHPHRGHRVWEINKKTLKVKVAEFLIRKEVDLSDALTTKKEIVTKPDCHYICALNQKNALRRLKLGKGHAQILPTDYKLVKIIPNW